ncbi:D-alanyl-D-alanine carboxypeptidase [Streptomyces aquilus]|uniref:D-alanyl-D-alanine carboxypeptidase n=1 Tax=Streptomyces aquilus TaxID=2548456 RepID=UPI0036A1E5D4
MAGESPDRSKQRESSAEPTSGSAGPVPEARGEVRDPRLAVARDADGAGAGADSGSGSGAGGVDTATRVFSVRDVAKARESAARAETPADAAAEAAENAPGTVSGDAGSGEGGDARLRAAVAAWVRSGDGTPEKTEDAGETGAGAEADGESRTGTDGEAETGADGVAEAKSEADEEEKADGAGAGADGEVKADPAEAGADGGTKAGAAETKAAAETDADSAPDDPGADGGRRASEGPEGASTAAEEAETAAEEPETAADVAEAAKGDAERHTGEPEPTASDDPEASEEPEDTPPVSDTPTEPEDTPQPADEPRDAKGAAEPADEPRDARDAAEPADAPRDGRDAAEPADAPRDGRDAAEPADKPAPAAPKADPRAATGTAAATTPAPGTAGPATDAPRDARGGSAPQGSSASGAESRDAAPATDAPQAAGGQKAPEGPPAPGDESRAGGAGGKSGGADGEAEAPVDQPTTMLKLPRPDTHPGVDRATSKFVALKPDVTTAVPQVGPERTTQQPLPPKPPLDLLAELTNTPPPPETPLRTTVRRVKIWTPLVLLLAVVFAVVQSVRPLPTPTLQLTAEETYSFDGGKADIPWPAQGQAALEVQGIGSFGSSGEQKPVPIASVAKVMTAYLILRDHPLKGDAKGPMIKVDQAAEDQASAEGESTVKVKAGDEISEREALQGILIASANNVARLVARWDAGSEKAFVAKMNAAAKDLGMTNTTYTDPSGLHDTTVSTAVDQVKLAKKAMQEPAFRAVASMMEYYDYKGARQPNWNQLVGKNGVIGIKTGTTTSARGNLVFAATKEIGGETRTIFGAVLRQPEGGYDNTILQGALSAGDKLIRAAQESLKSATILKKGDVVGYVDDGLGGKTPVVATKDVSAVGWSGLTVKLTFAADDVPHTAKAGTKVGTLTVGDASAGAVSVPVALQKDLVEPGFADKLTRLG